MSHLKVEVEGNALGAFARASEPITPSRMGFYAEVGRWKNRLWLATTKWLLTLTGMRSVASMTGLPQKLAGGIVIA